MKCLEMRLKITDRPNPRYTIFYMRNVVRTTVCFFYILIIIVSFYQRLLKSSHFSISTMQDKPAIVNFLVSNHYIQENYALEKENERLQHKISRLHDEIRMLGRRLNSRNHHIGILEERIQFNEYHYERQLQLQRVLVSLDGSLHVFRRNDDGIFVQVPEDDDSTESEPEIEPRGEEAAQEIARRLGFDSDSDGYISDDLMRSLLEEEL